jgi:hypothetical protein
LRNTRKKIEITGELCVWLDLVPNSNACYIMYLNTRKILTSRNVITNETISPNSLHSLTAESDDTEVDSDQDQEMSTPSVSARGESDIEDDINMHSHHEQHHEHKHDDSDITGLSQLTIAAQQLHATTKSNEHDKDEHTKDDQDVTQTTPEMSSSPHTSMLMTI